MSLCVEVMARCANVMSDFTCVKLTLWVSISSRKASRWLTNGYDCIDSELPAFCCTSQANHGASALGNDECNATKKKTRENPSPISPFFFCFFFYFGKLSSQVAEKRSEISKTSLDSSRNRKWRYTCTPRPQFLFLVVFWRSSIVLSLFVCCDTQDSDDSISRGVFSLHPYLYEF